MVNLFDIVRDKLSMITSEWKLSDREGQIVHLIFQDITSTKDIADKLDISPITVRNHLEKVYKKSGCKNKNTLIINVVHRYMEDNKNLSLFYRSPRVLVVDDEPDICEVLEMALTDRGVKVHSTTDPIKVANLLKCHQFDFIISDLKMPGLDGKDLIKQIKQDHYYWPQIIIMTGFGKFLPEELYNQGVISYFTKPFKPDALFEIILENYSDEKNIIQKIISTPDSDTINSLDKTFSLNSKNMGSGGLFISLNYDEIKKYELKKDSNIKFNFKITDFSDETYCAIGKVIWTRISANDKFQSGVGVKLLNMELCGTTEYKNFLIDNKIISFIPIGETSD
ncbi:response regulator [Bacteriovoracaceae bacterium]|nr:response regulator [Bacteriovoracaceae bacterium]